MIVQDVDGNGNVNSIGNNVVNQDNVQESFKGVVKHFQMCIQNHNTTYGTY